MTFGDLFEYNESDLIELIKQDNKYITIVTEILKTRGLKLCKLDNNTYAITGLDN